MFQHPPFFRMLGPVPGLAALVLMFGLSPVFAQSQGENPESPETGPVGRETIVVIGWDQPESVKDESRDVMVIDVGRARAAGVTTVADVLRMYAALDIVTSGVMPGSVTSAFVRGGESSYTLILLDDVEVNRPGGFYDLAHLSLDDVERIEILKGPGSTLYGSEAMTGVIRIYTRQGGGRTRVRIHGQAGSFSTFTEGVDITGGFGRSWRYSAAASRLDSRRQRPVNDDYARTAAAVSLGTDFHNGGSLTLRYRFTKALTHFPTGAAGDLFDVLDPGQYTDTREDALSLAWEGRWGGDWSTRVTLGYVRLDQEYVDEDNGPEVDPFGEFRSHTRDDRWKADIRVTRALGSHRVSFGLGYEREKTRQDDLFTPEAQTYDRTDFAVYAQDVFHGLDGRMDAAAGVRYETHDDYGDVLSPQFSLGWWVTSKLKVRGAVGFGFKAPAFYQVHGFPGFSTGNPDLKPEQNVGWDAGFEYWEKASYPVVRVSYFENRFRDIIEFVFGVEEGSPNYFNLQAARARGVEAAVTYRWDRFLLRGEYTYTETETTDAGQVVFPGDAYLEGAPLLRRPKHRAVISLGYETERFSLECDILYQGSRWDLDFSQGFVPTRVKLDPYTRIDLRARARIWKHVSVTARIENLLNTDYQEIFGYRGGKFGAFGGLDVTF